MLTNSELNQIKNFLALHGKKDSQLSLITEEELSTDETTVYLSIVQDNKNYRITLDLLRKAVLEGLVDDDIYGIIDNQPVSGSRNLVRSGGVYNAINDPKVIHESQVDDDAVSTRTIQNNAVVTAKIADDNVTDEKLSDAVRSAMSKFTNDITASSPSTREIGVASMTANLTIKNEVTYYGDRAARDVTPYVVKPSIEPKTTGDTVANNVWSLKPSVGTHRIEYKSTYNNLQLTSSASITLFLYKSFGFSKTTDDSVPDGVEELPTKDYKSALACEFTVNAIDGLDDTNKLRYIWFAVPDNFTIGVDEDTNEANIIQTATGYKLKVAKFDDKYYTTITRTINISNTNYDYTYKLYRSLNKVDATSSIKFKITN